MQNNAHYRVGYRVSYRLRVEMYESARVDMIANQADKQKIWEVMESWMGSKL